MFERLFPFVAEKWAKGNKLEPRLGEQAKGNKQRGISRGEKTSQQLTTIKQKNSLLERDKHRTPYRKVTGKVTCIVTSKVTCKVTSKVTDKVAERVTERRHLEMQFCNDAIDERTIRLPSNGRKRNARLTTRALDKEKTG